jgi:hypothetical protein
MPTIVNTTAAEPILAIDLVKYKSFACLQRSFDDHCFLAFATNRT